MECDDLKGDGTSPAPVGTGRRSGSKARDGRDGSVWSSWVTGPWWREATTETGDTTNERGTSTAGTVIGRESGDGRSAIRTTGRCRPGVVEAGAVGAIAGRTGFVARRGARRARGWSSPIVISVSETDAVLEDTADDDTSGRKSGLETRAGCAAERGSSPAAMEAGEGRCAGGAPGDGKGDVIREVLHQGRAGSSTWGSAIGAEGPRPRSGPGCTWRVATRARTRPKTTTHDATQVQTIPRDACPAGATCGDGGSAVVTSGDDRLRSEATPSPCCANGAPGEHVAERSSAGLNGCGVIPLRSSMAL
jgi:hypothetical protein